MCVTSSANAMSEVTCDAVMQPVCDISAVCAGCTGCLKFHCNCQSFSLPYVDEYTRLTCLLF